MAEKLLSDIVIHKTSWIESLYEYILKLKTQKESLYEYNLKLEEQNGSLTRENEQLRAELSVLQKVNHQSHQIQARRNVEDTKLVQPHHLQQSTAHAPTTSSISIHQQQASELDQHRNLTPMVLTDQHHLLSPRQQQDHQTRPQPHIMQSTTLSIGETSTANGLQHVVSQPQQVIYQPIPVANAPFVPQPQYVWTAYDSSVPTPHGIGGYYEQYSNANTSAAIPPTSFVPSQP